MPTNDPERPRKAHDRIQTCRLAVLYSTFSSPPLALFPVERSPVSVDIVGGAASRQRVHRADGEWSRFLEENQQAKKFHAHNHSRLA
jgi:hypothetical protein